MNGTVASMLKSARNMLQWAVEPLDATSRLLNNKRGYPPLRLRQSVGGLNDFEGSGAEYLSYLKLLCDLEPQHKVLDIGCGCGLMAIDTTGAGALPDYLTKGQYVGIDNDKRAVEWCKTHLNGQFYLSNGDLTEVAKMHRRFDIVLVKSVFTHLHPEEVTSYLRQISKLLGEGGVCLSTFFLERDVMQSRFKFNIKTEVASYEWAHNRRRAVCYPIEWVIGVLKEVGLNMWGIYLGTWNNEPGLSFQDIIVARKWL